MFRQMDLKGQAQVNTKLKSTHQNTVTAVRAFQESNGQVSSFSSKIFLPTIEKSKRTNQIYSERCRWSCRDLVYLTRTLLTQISLLEYKQSQVTYAQTFLLFSRPNL